MLGIFRSSLPNRIILLIGVAIILISLSIIYSKPIETHHFRLLLNSSKINNGLYLYNTIYDYSGIIPTYINSFFISLFGYQNMITKIFAGILIFINAIYFNSIVDKYKLIEERSFIPGFLSLIISFSVYQNLELNSILIANMFITLAISSFLKIGLEKEDKSLRSFIGGSYIGLAFLCDQIFILFLFLAVIVLLYYASKGYTNYIALMIGFSFPMIIVFNIYMFFGYQEDFLYYYFYTYFFKTSANNQGVDFSFYLPWIVFSFVSLGVYNIKRVSVSFKNYTSKALQIIIIWFLITLIILYFIKERQLSSTYILVNTLSFFLSFYVLYIQRKWLFNLIPFLILIFAFFFNFNIENNHFIKLSTITQNSIEPTDINYDGKVLLLGDDMSIYYNNEHGSAFTNWKLEKTSFLNIYELGNLEKIYLGITCDYPKYIIDPHGIFDRIVEHIPLLRKKYKKLDSKTYRFINNS